MRRRQKEERGRHGVRGSAEGEGRTNQNNQVQTKIKSGCITCNILYIYIVCHILIEQVYQAPSLLTVLPHWWDRGRIRRQWAQRQRCFGTVKRKAAGKEL